MHQKRVAALNLALALAMFGCGGQPTETVSSPDATSSTQPSTVPPGATPTPRSGAPSPDFHPVDDVRFEMMSWRTVSEPFTGSPNDDVSGLFLDPDARLVAWGGYQRHSETEVEAGAAFSITTDGVDWRQSLLVDSEPGIHVADVALGPHGYVAVGSVGSQSAAWWSIDGLTWTRSVIDPVALPETEALLSVSAGPHGYLAVGGVGGDDQSRPAGWSSTTGSEWLRIEVADLEGWLKDVALAADGGFVAIGVDYSGAGTHELIWQVSGDGLEWHRARPLEETDGTGMDDLDHVLSIAGGYAAYGQHAPLGEELECKGCYWDPELWRAYTSADGLAWQRHAIVGTGSPTPAFPWYEAIEPWGELLLAVGRADDDTSRLWRSADGVTWEAIGDPIILDLPHNDAPSPEDLLVAGRHLVIGGFSLEGGYVAIGSPVN